MVIFESRRLAQGAELLREAVAHPGRVGEIFGGWGFTGKIIKFLQC